MIYLKILASLIIVVMVLVVVVYRLYVLLSKKYDKKEKLSAVIELLLISCFLILSLG